MKNLFLHYVVLLLPPCLWVGLDDCFSSCVFMVGLLVWAFGYIPFLNGRRLYKKGLADRIKWSGFLYLFPEKIIEVYFKP